MHKMIRLLVPLTGTALLLSACGSTSSPSASTPAASHSHDHDHDHESSPASSSGAGATKEVSARAPRLVMTTDHGLLVVDAQTLKVIKEIPHEVPPGGLLRLRESGDPRYPLVDSGTKLGVIDLGSWTQAHGDHGHSKITAPSLTTTALTVAKAGHVSALGPKTAVFDDGDGSVEVYDNATFGTANPKPTRTVTLPAHHGNAIPLPGDKLLHTIAKDGSAHGVAIIDAAGKKVVESTQCPGTHGAAIAQGGAITIGCQDGALLVKGDTITKIPGGASFSRMGNMVGSEQSPYVLADYKRGPEAKPSEVAIIDTRSGTLKTVKLGAEYTFRGLGVAADGQAVALTNDGKLHLIDPATATVTHSIQVMSGFTEPTEWTQPRPTVHAQGHWVYVTEPATKKVHAIELSVRKVMATGTLPDAPNEVTGTLG